MAPILPLSKLHRGLDARIGRILAAAEVPGAAVAVVHEGRSYVGCWGLRRVGAPEPITPVTAFDLGSCSKSFVATAVALLVADGALGYDDPVQRWLPEMQLDSAALSAQLTVRDLLCNRIGLKRQVPVESLANANYSALQLIRRVRFLDRLHPFRAGYVYFNPGFMAARLVVEHASGLSYGAFLERRLFRPLGMRQSASGAARVAALDHRASNHVRWRGAVVASDLATPDHWQGAAGVHCSARDAARWLQFQLERGAGLLPARVLDQTWRPHTAMPRGECKLIHCPPEARRVDYAMGWWITRLHGRRLVQHAGEMVGWRAHTALLPAEGSGVVVMLSLGAPRHAALAYTVLETLLLRGGSRDWCAVADRMAADLAETTRQQLAAAFPAGTRAPLPLERYAGTYAHPACGAVKVVVQDGGLRARFADGRLWDLVARPLGGHVFETRPNNAAIADYLPVPLRMRFDVRGGRAHAMIDTQARYVRIAAMGRSHRRSP